MKKIIQTYRFGAPLLSVLLLLLCLQMQAQKQPSKDAGEDNANQQVEDLIDVIADEVSDSEVSNDTYVERFSDFLDDPLDMNKATFEQLSELDPLLSREQIEGILKYREQVGDFISKYELQSVPELDLATIRKIDPFVKAGGDLMRFNVPFKDLMTKGTHQVFFRYSQILESQRGYQKIDTLPDGTAYSQYAGSPQRLYARYRYNYGNKISYGVTGEKDPGEEFFKGSNRKGFDFYSAHFYMRDVGPLKHLALGDYELRLGQGLVAWSGLGQRKSAFVMQIMRQGQTIRPYTSINEALFHRGAAATIGLGKKWEATAFGSWRKRDANVIDTTNAGDYNLVDIETGEVVDEFAVEDADIGDITSLQTSGLHRTQSEIKDRNAIDQYTMGGNISYKTRPLSVGFNALYSRLSRELSPADLPYNIYRFSGNSLLDMSVDYKALVRNFTFFGETAMSDNGGIATLNGMLLSLDKKIFMSVAQRYYSPTYQSLFGAAFGENSLPNNESGLFFGLTAKPIKNWTLTAYYDLYRSPWLRFKTDGPSHGYDALVRLTWTPVRELETYVQYRYENKKSNAPDNITDSDFLDDNMRSSLRYQIDYKLTKAVRLRSRAEFSWFQAGDNPREKGYAVMQDIIVKPLGSPLSFNARFALFDTDSYNTRIYAYENDVLFVFAIPPYYYRGSRYYFTLRYRLFKNVDVWLRYAQTYWSNQNEIGSGNELINGHTRSEIKAMLRVKL